MLSLMATVGREEPVYSLGELQSMLDGMMQDFTSPQPPPPSSFFSSTSSSTRFGAPSGGAQQQRRPPHAYGLRGSAARHASARRLSPAAKHLRDLHRSSCVRGDHRREDAELP
eukprot:UN18956